MTTIRTSPRSRSAMHSSTWSTSPGTAASTSTTRPCGRSGPQTWRPRNGSSPMRRTDDTLEVIAEAIGRRRGHDPATEDDWDLAHAALHGALDAVDAERDAWKEKARIMTAKRDAGTRVAHDVRKQRNDALTRLHEIRTVLDRYDEQRHSGLWIDIGDILGEGIR